MIAGENLPGLDLLPTTCSQMVATLEDCLVGLSWSPDHLPRSEIFPWGRILTILSSTLLDAHMQMIRSIVYGMFHSLHSKPPWIRFPLCLTKRYVCLAYQMCLRLNVLSSHLPFDFNLEWMESY